MSRLLARTGSRRDVSCRDEGDPSRRGRARAGRRRYGSRRGTGDRAQARRAGRARALERLAARPAGAARRRSAGAVPDHARRRRPRRALRPAPLERPPARRGGSPPLPGRQGRDRPADRERLLLRLRVSRADLRGRPGADRGGGQARARRGANLRARGGLARRGAGAVRGRARALQARAARHGRRRHLALHPVARRRAGVHRPLPRPAPAGLLADQGLQADRARRRLLARRRAKHAADADLRHRLLPSGRPRVPPGAARGGAPARPPPARDTARPLPLLGRLARLAVLAPEGDGDLERARRPPPTREPRPRLRRGADAAALRLEPLGHLRPLGEVPRAHVHLRVREPRVRPEADELPRPLRALRGRLVQLPRAAAADGRGRCPPPRRAGRRAARPAAGADVLPGRRAHLLHAASRSRTR